MIYGRDLIQLGGPLLSHSGRARWIHIQYKQLSDLDKNNELELLTGQASAYSRCLTLVPMEQVSDKLSFTRARLSSPMTSAATHARRPHGHHLGGQLLGETEQVNIRWEQTSHPAR